MSGVHRQWEGPLYDPAPYRVPDASAEDFDTSSSRISFDSTRLGFTCLLSETLKPAHQSDVRALSNVEQWLFQRVTSGRASPAMGRTIQKLARDCVHGNNPMAVFMARMKRELGYTPPSRMEKTL
jgi:hypothetical protein